MAEIHVKRGYELKPAPGWWFNSAFITEEELSRLLDGSALLYKDQGDELVRVGLLQEDHEFKFFEGDPTFRAVRVYKPTEKFLNWVEEVNDPNSNYWWTNRVGRITLEKDCDD